MFMGSCIFVSGYGSPGFEWRISPLRNLLACHGWDTYCFRSGFSHVKRASEHVAEFLDNIDGPVSAVGHSMGGIVCRAVDVMTGRLDQVVTLGSPHSGVNWLNLLPIRPGALRQLRYESGFLSWLDATKHRAEYLCIAGERDPLVPRDSAWNVKGAKTAIIPAGHAEMFLRRDVAQLAGEFLGLSLTT